MGELGERGYVSAMTRSQIDRPGDKLRKTQPPDEAQLEKLQDFRTPYSL